jgi:hypothetical protein
MNEREAARNLNNRSFQPRLGNRLVMLRIVTETRPLVRKQSTTCTQVDVEGAGQITSIGNAMRQMQLALHFRF